MTAKINRVPDGLQGILDSKTLGENPDDLLGDIRPTLDLRSLFLANAGIRGDAATASVSAASLGMVVAPVTVPSGELWFVVSVSSDVVGGLTGGDNYATSPVVEITTGLGAHFLASHWGAEETINTGERGVTVANFSPEVIAPPGTVFGSVPIMAFASTAAVTTSVLHYTVQV